MINNYSFSNFTINLNVNGDIYNLTKRANGNFTINQSDNNIFSNDAYNDGSIIFSKKLDKRGSVTLIYSQVSSACDDLDSIFKQLENGNIQPTNINGEILDLLGNKQWELISVAIEKPADENIQQSVSDRSYNLICAEVDKTLT